MVSLRSTHVWSLGWLLVASAPLAASDRDSVWPTVEDAIEMVRIQPDATATSRIGAFSPDGKLFAFVRFHGDLKRNVNVYELSVVDLQREPRVRTVLTREYAGDAADQDASPFEQIAFLSDNQTIAYLGRDDGKAQQVFSLNINTAELRQLTHSATQLREFVAHPDTGVSLYSTAIASDGDTARTARLEEDGVFLWEEELFRPARNLKSQAILRLVDDPQPLAFRQYFAHTDGRASLIYDSRQNRSPDRNPLPAEIDRGVSVQVHLDASLRYWGTLTADPTGQLALLYPFRPFQDRAPSAENPEVSRWNAKMEAPYGLVNIATGSIDLFVDVPHAIGRAPGGSPPVWSPDGKSVLLFGTLRSPTGKPRPQWIDVDVATRKFQAVGVPEGWQVVGWYGASAGVVLSTVTALR